MDGPFISWSIYSCGCNFIFSQVPSSKIREPISSNGEASSRSGGKSDKVKRKEEKRSAKEVLLRKPSPESGLECLIRALTVLFDCLIRTLTVLSGRVCFIREASSRSGGKSDKIKRKEEKRSAKEVRCLANTP